MALLCLTTPFFDAILTGLTLSGLTGFGIGLTVALTISVANLYVVRTLGRFWWRWRDDPSINWQARAFVLLATVMLWSLVSGLAGIFATRFLGRFWFAHHAAVATA